MTNYKLLKIEIKPYYKTLYVSIGIPEDKVISILKKKKLFNFTDKTSESLFLENIIGNGDGRCTQLSNMKYFIHIGDHIKMATPIGISILVHELTHCVSFIFESIGMPHTSDSDEAYAYLLGYLVEEILNQITI